MFVACIKLDVTRFHPYYFALILALSSVATAQDAPLARDFLKHLNEFSGYKASDQRTPQDRLQNELHFTPEDAESVLATDRDFQTRSLAIQGALKGRIMQRRLAAIAGESMSTPPESELVEESNRSKEKVAQVELESLKSQLGAAKFEAFTDYIGNGRYRVRPPFVALNFN